MRLVVASGNTHKVGEIADMLRASVPDLKVVGMGELGDAPSVPETAETFGGNALLKARGIAAWLREQGADGGDLVLADDSGICIDTFGGGPGVYSARFAGPEATDEENNARMVQGLEDFGVDRSPAHYACVLALTRVDGQALQAPQAERVSAADGAVCIEGRCHGYVRKVRRGDGGFGYDPYFWVDEDARTFAELSREQKAERSHRGAAIRLLVQHLPKIVA